MELASPTAVTDNVVNRSSVIAWLRERRLRALSTSAAGSLMAVEADPRETNSATAAAGECQVRVGDRMFMSPRR